MKSVKRAAQQARAADAAERKKIANPSTKTADSVQNFAAALGMGTNNLMSNTTYGFNPISRIRTLVEWIHRGSWLGGMAVDIVANDMTRAGVELKGDLDPADTEKLHEAATNVGLWKKINETIKWSRLYGGAIGVHLIEGQDFSTPLRADRIGKNAYKGLLVLDRWMVEPSLENLVEDLGPYLGLPKYYRVTTWAPALIGQRIHYTRCFRILGIQLPYWQSLMENMWGISVYERMYDRMVGFDSATLGASQLTFKSFLRIIKIKDLRQNVASGGPFMNELLKYVQLMSLMQTNEGITMLDGEDEFETQSTTAFSGISDVILQLAQQLAGAMEIPLVKLMGQSPAGLNSTGESDLRNYYDGINEKQNTDLLLPVTLSYRALALSEGIKLPDGFSLAFRPLWQLTSEQKGNVATSVTDAVVKAKEAGIIGDQVALQELKQASDTSGVFTNITREDIEKAEREPAPPADELLPGEGGGGKAGKAEKSNPGEEG